MTAANAYREWAACPEADRRAFVWALLGRPEVAAWVESYAGDRTPGAVVRATESAGLGLDQVDAGLLALLLEENFATRNATATSEGAKEWRDTMPSLMRQSYAREKLDTPQIHAFVESYRGGQDLETIAQAIESRLPELDTMDGGLLALVMAEQFEEGRTKP